jgi:transcriptional repressor NrdR
MRCPECQHDDSKVIDSRPGDDAIRRRRECLQCGHRFTTHERIERRLPWVVKRDGRREPFVREKLLHGLALACRKRPVDAAQMEEVVRRVESGLEASRDAEVPSSAVGRALMEEIRQVDEVAYVRFASVYQAFDDAGQFADIIRPLLTPAARRRTSPVDEA